MTWMTLGKCLWQKIMLPNGDVKNGKYLIKRLLQPQAITIVSRLKPQFLYRYDTLTQRIFQILVKGGR